MITLQWVYSHTAFFEKTSFFLAFVILLYLLQNVGRLDQLHNIVI